MADGFYSLHAQVISRGAGRSAVAAAAYRSGTDLIRVHKDGHVEHHDYTRRQGVDQIGIALPADAPEWAANREQLWCRVEETEKRKDAQLCREFRVAFDHRMNPEQRHEVLHEFMGQQFTDKGYAADWAIHKPDKEGDDRNWHAHVLVPLRTFDGEEFARTKAQEYGNWNNRTDRLEEWRAQWATVQNRAAQRYGLCDSQGESLTFDHRSYDDRNIDQEPTQHLGPDATALERQGVQTEIGNQNRAMQERNALRNLHHRQAQFESGSLLDQREVSLPVPRQAHKQVSQPTAAAEVAQAPEQTRAAKEPSNKENTTSTVTGTQRKAAFGKPQLWDVWDAAERRDARREHEEEQQREQQHKRKNPFDKIIEQGKAAQKNNEPPKEEASSNFPSVSPHPANDNDDKEKRRRHGLEL